MLLALVVLVSGRGLASSAWHQGIEVGSSLCVQGSICLCDGCGVLAVCLFGVVAYVLLVPVVLVLGQGLASSAQHHGGRW